MDLMTAIKTRRSVRRYKHTLVDDQKITECLEAATWAPSADNSQPWEFIIVRRRDEKEACSYTHVGKVHG